MFEFWFFFFKQKTAYEMRISDWSSDVCSSDLFRLEDAFSGCTREIEVDVAARCETCDGSGAKPGTRTNRCQTCAGHGKVRAQQGFFMVERTCPTCQGAGEVIAEDRKSDV